MKRSENFRLIDLVAWAGAATFLVYGLTRSADAAATAPAAVFATECGSCHVAYPAKLLPSADWSKVLGSLERHYGVDASLDAQTLATVAAYLKAGVPAAGAASTTRSLPRITTSEWFRREHRELAPGAWSAPAVKSAANCSACHTGAERGNFDEHSVRLPGGVQLAEGEENERED